MVKIGIMSFAHLHADSYAACVQAIPEASLAAIWDDNARRGRAKAKELETPFIGNLDKFLASDLDAVIVTSENTKHRGLVEAAAAAGKWVLCEKPLAPTLEDARAMVSACRKAGVGLGTAFPCRYALPIVEAKAKLDSGEFGEVYAVSCTNHGKAPGGWFADDELSGGGATMDHTVHVVDLLRWMLDREFTRVYCELGNQLHQKTLKTDDLGSLHLEMKGGVQVGHLASWSRPDCYPTWGDVTLEFICEGGVINVDAFNQKVTLYDGKAGRVNWVPWGDDANLALIRDFVEAVREKREPTIDGVDGLHATAVTLAAYESFRSGAAVKL
ncbi:MAG: Gfo/Idh/MocA family oxidoreductase [Candidatus Hydrogenedentes bacterium]|jgi:predicted dehydrogenase|nr:Gfo/Idh/MocA family oxidoreductase [Candidatus Hydrogenedentota bacterium]